MVCILTECTVVFYATRLSRPEKSSVNFWFASVYNPFSAGEKQESFTKSNDSRECKDFKL